MDQQILIWTTLATCVVVVLIAMLCIRVSTTQDDQEVEIDEIDEPDHLEVVEEIVEEIINETVIEKDHPDIYADRSMDPSNLIWIQNKGDADIWTQGFICVSIDPIGRHTCLKWAGTVEEDSERTIIFEGPRWECSAKAFEYRPHAKIGLNKTKCGRPCTNPVIRSSEFGRKMSDILENRTDSERSGQAAAVSKSNLKVHASKTSDDYAAAAVKRAETEAARSPARKAEVKRNRGLGRKRYLAGLTPEARAAWVAARCGPFQKAMSEKTSQERSEYSRKGRARMSPARRSEIALKSAATLRANRLNNAS